MKRKQSLVKTAEHVNPQEYYKLRNQVIACTDIINEWLLRGQKNSHDISRCLAEKLKTLLNQKEHTETSIAFMLSMHFSDLPSSLECEEFYPYCQFAQDVLTFQLLLLKELIGQEQQSIQACSPEKNETLLRYPKYDTWLIAAFELANQDNFPETEAPLVSPEAFSEMEQKTKKIIDLSKNNAIKTQSINDAFSTVCPVCSELIKIQSKG